jgi:hypothetical protein
VRGCRRLVARRRPERARAPVKVRRRALQHGVAVATDLQLGHVLTALVEKLRLRFHQTGDQARSQLFDPDRHRRRGVDARIVFEEILHRGP